MANENNQNNQNNQNNKLTLIIDGNWLLMSRLSIVASKYQYDAETMIRELRTLMIRSIKVVLRTFPIIDNVIFVADGGSWRNSIEAPGFLKNEGIEYKGNRTHDSEIDLDLVFSAYDDMLTILSENGINVCREKGIEGDDWCSFLSKKLNSQNINVIIWSKDKDLTQLVDINENKCFTVCWTKDGGLILPDIEDDDIDALFEAFTPGVSDNSKLLKTIEQKSNNISKINPNSIVIDKIIRGDAGDNIQPIIIKKPSNPKSTRIYRVSSKDINENIDPYNDKEVYNYIQSLCEMKQYKNRLNDKSIDNIFEHFIYNRKLVSLDKRSMPDNIYKIMDSYKIKYINKDFSIIEQKFSAANSDLSDILDLV